MRPMLSAKFDNSKGHTRDKLEFPVIVSPKLDGIRCLITVDGVVSRKLKAIPNEFVRRELAGCLPGLDGELLTFTNGAMDDYNTVQSKIMSRDGEPDFQFWVFDDFTNPDVPYSQRRPKQLALPRCKIVPVSRIFDLDDLDEKEQEYIDAGYEGIMLRNPRGPYKFGRSTFNQQYLIKLKRWTDSEAIITGFEELMHNMNEATTDERGYTKRSSHKANKVPGDTLGRIFATDVHDGTKIQVGTFKGLTRPELKEIWDNREQYLGKQFTYSFFDHGRKDKPRHPKLTFLHFRHTDC